MTKYIECGADLKCFNAFVALSKLSMPVAIDDTAMNMPEEDISCYGSTENNQPPLENREVTNVDHSDTASPENKENRVPMVNVRTFGKPFLMVGRRPKHGIFYRNSSEHTDSRRFKF